MKDISQWRERASKLRALTAVIDEVASHFNLEREGCSCGESHRWKDMNQWQLNERLIGVGERLQKIASDIERRAVEFVPKTNGKVEP